MKTKADPYVDAPVLAAAIADDAFSSFADSLKHAGVQAVRRHRHIRQARIVLTQLLCVVGIATLFWFNHSKPQQIAGIAPAVAPAASGAASAHYISEDQMLAMFPSGSCVVAEVNGRKELVFLNQKSPNQITQ